MNTEHTPGPWSTSSAFGVISNDEVICRVRRIRKGQGEANACLIAAAPDLLAALKIARVAIGEHYAPHDCYATGPLTGNHYLDLVACPACAFIKLHDAAIAKAEGKA